MASNFEKTFMRDTFRIQFEKAERLVESTWQRIHTFHRTLYVWPDPQVTKDTEGQQVNGVLIKLLTPQDNLLTIAKHLAKQTNAQALLSVERQGDTLFLLMEHPHGTVCSTYPIYRSVDIDVLGQKETSTDSVFLGILWRPPLTH